MKPRTVVITGAIGTVIGGLVLNFLGWVPIAGWLGIAGSGIAAAWHWLGEPGSVPHWLLILLVLGAVAWVALILALFIGHARDSRKPGSAQGGKAYTEDVFYNMTWRWVWGREGPYNFACFCQKCDLQIVPRSAPSGIVFSCADCSVERYKTSYDVTYVELRDEIAMRVQRNARRAVTGRDQTAA